MREYTEFGLLKEVLAGSPKLDGTAACSTLPTKVVDLLFFGQDEMGNSLRGIPLREASVKAKQVCAGCPVIEGCLGHAMKQNIPYGVWGRKTHLERKSMKKPKK